MIKLFKKFLFASVLIFLAFTTNENIKEVSDGSFKKDIKNGIVVIDFWATWCGPCRMQAPIFENIAEEMGKEATFGRFDIDKNQIVPSLYNISSIPTILVFKDGKLAWRFEGLTDKSTLTETIKSVINKK